jgi:hypothetical protein
MEYIELQLPMPLLEPIPVEEQKEERGFAIIIGGEEPASGPVFPRPPGGRDARD